MYHHYIVEDLFQRIMYGIERKRVDGMMYRACLAGEEDAQLCTAAAAAANRASFLAAYG